MGKERIKEEGLRVKEKTRKMKDSGVEWIGEVPEEWEVTKLKNVSRYESSSRTSSAIKTKEEGKYEFYGASGVEGYIDDYDMAKDYISIVKDGAGAGRVCYNLGKSSVTNTMGYILNNEKYIELKFLYFILKNLPLDIYIKKTTIPHVYYSEFKYELAPVPVQREQKAIINFLDSKVSLIDDIIEKTKQSIGDYKKYKQSLITETVTKGLNPDVEMKDSGIEWIGEIPEHWDVVNLNRLYSQVKEKNEGLVEENLLSLSYGEIVKRDINSNEGLLPASFEGYNIINNGNIVLRLTDLQNDHTSLRVGFCTQTGIITSAYISLKGEGKRIDKYMYYYLHSFDIYKGFYGMGAGVRQSLTFDGIKNLKLLYPPITEQQQIVDYLDNKCLQIDRIIGQKEKLIKELETYKKSLIYEYVTGKTTVEM